MLISSVRDCQPEQVPLEDIYHERIDGMGLNKC